MNGSRCLSRQNGPAQSALAGAVLALAIGIAGGATLTALAGARRTHSAIVAIVVGVPIGAAVGRAAWTLVTDRLGLPPDAMLPGTTLFLVALAALVAANVIAVGPGLLANRTPPARILRAE